MDRFVLIGNPLGHSLSPQIHEELFRQKGIAAEYRLLDVVPQMLESTIPHLRTLKGFNVTIPYKQTIIPYLDGLDATALRYGAVNCVVNRKGRLIGYNTDCIGFIAALGGKSELLSRRVVLLGCGGAGRMMAIEALMKGAELYIAVRGGASVHADSVVEEAKRMKLSCLPKITDINDEAQYPEKIDILLNSTPVGMYPKVEFSPVSEEIVKRCGCVFDAVYNPERTMLLKYVEDNGVTALGGMKMLVEQAKAGQKIWYAK